MPLIENKLIAFALGFLLFVILPVWVFNFVDLGFLMKLAFTVAGGVGIYLALTMGTLRKRR